MPIGIAFRVGHVPDPKGPIATFRLMIGKTDRLWRYTCVGRRFVLVDLDTDALGRDCTL
jgi:hypothetical protein